MGYSYTKTCPVFRRWVTIEDDIEWWVIVTLYIFWHIIGGFFKYRNNVVDNIVPNTDVSFTL
jgi:hypothetical protein